ncbi:MAG: FCD domain-containing protein [Caldilineaceae bacterium]|nr:FCD domain-containing protein [Caldilineaceae bacterium]
MIKQLHGNSELLHYIVNSGFVPGARLPSLNELSDELGVSIGKLREQLEGARVLGLVAARPRRGIECNSYSFTPAARASLMFGLATNERLFREFSELRNGIESAFWQPAVLALTAADKQDLKQYVSLAWHKLQQSRIQIPHQEHRAFHLTIFRRLDNLFATGLLEAYWDAYEAVELNLYADYDYLTEVWSYHERIAGAIEKGLVDEARALNEEHLLLLRIRGVSRNNLPQDSEAELTTNVRSKA